MAYRTRPNDRFAWFIDNNGTNGERIAIVVYRSSTETNNKAGMYDTYDSDNVTDGLRIHYHAKYPSVSALANDLSTSSYVDTGLHPAIVDYVKFRLEEDMGNLDKAQYFFAKYEAAIKSFPHRKSGHRSLSVPKL